ncbi:MAG: mono/diheme cytochrome c family protein [Myxococcota bacterium]|jgi:mono/diheme cytochrome c family protein
MRIAAVLFALIACGTEPAAPTPAPAPAKAAPAKAKPAPAPAPEAAAAPAGEPDAAAGAKVYGQYCVACHQADGSGMNGMLAANFKEEGRLDKSDEELLTSIRDGFQGKVGMMPPWKGTLTPQQMVDVLAHVRATYGEK